MRYFVKEKRNLTIDDIARELGVSKTTVSRALSGKGRIGNETRERVLAYTQKHNYRPSAAAKSLAESKTYNLALVLPKEFIRLDLPFIRQSMSAICEEAFLHNYNILLCLAAEDNADAVARTLNDRKVDGVILSRTVEGDQVLNLLIRQDIPFATMGSMPPHLWDKATVEADNDHTGGSRTLTKTLLGSARGKIALLGGDLHHIVNQSRLEGFRQAVRDLPPEKYAIHTGLSGSGKCDIVLEELLNQGFRSFIATDDDICMQIISFLEGRGLSIPIDAQVASFYDSEGMRSHTPGITTLEFDEEALGRAACRELLRYLQGEEYESRVRLSYQIAHRGSWK